MNYCTSILILNKTLCSFVRSDVSLCVPFLKIQNHSKIDFLELVNRKCRTYNFMIHVSIYSLYVCQLHQGVYRWNCITIILRARAKEIQNPNRKVLPLKYNVLYKVHNFKLFYWKVRFKFIGLEFKFWSTFYKNY